MHEEQQEAVNNNGYETQNKNKTKQTNNQTNKQTKQPCSFWEPPPLRQMQM